MLNSEPTETAGPKPHLLSGLLQYAHTREARIAFSFSPLSPQGKNREEKRASLSNPTAKQQTLGLVVRSGHDSVKALVLWTHQVGETMHCSIEKALFRHALIIIVSSTETSQTATEFLFLALPAFDTTAWEGAKSLPASSLLVAIWVVCERRLTYGT